MKFEVPLGLTRKVTALDASQVRVHPEQLAYFVIDGKSNRLPQAAKEQNLPLCPVQRGPLDLR